MSLHGVWFIGDVEDGTIYTGLSGDDMWVLDKSKALPMNAVQTLEALEDVDCWRQMRGRLLPIPWEELGAFPFWPDDEEPA